MSFKVFRARYESLRASGPSFDTVASALQSAVPGPSWGAWVGLPRVTRPSRSPWVVEITALFEVPAGARPDVVQDIEGTVLANACAALQRMYPDGTVSAWTQCVWSTYDPAINGAVEAWRSNDMSRTRTRDDWDSGAVENPSGPAGVLPDQVTISDRLSQFVRQNPVLVGGIAVVAVGVTAVAVGRPIARAIAARAERDIAREARLSGMGAMDPGWAPQQFVVPQPQFAPPYPAAPYGSMVGRPRPSLPQRARQALARVTGAPRVRIPALPGPRRSR